MAETIEEYTLRKYLIVRGIASAILKTGEVKPQSVYIWQALNEAGIEDDRAAGPVCRELAVELASRKFQLDEKQKLELLSWLGTKTRKHYSSRNSKPASQGVSMETVRAAEQEVAEARQLAAAIGCSANLQVQKGERAVQIIGNIGGRRINLRYKPGAIVRLVA